MESRGVNLRLAELYSAKVKVSSGEQVTIMFVGSALRVFTQILNEPTVRGLILQACTRLPTCDACEQCFCLTIQLRCIVCFSGRGEWGKTTCWDSVTKLELLLRRGSTNVAVNVRKVISMLQGVEYYCDAKFISSSRLSIVEMGG